jgi:MarR family 2-MHQ and catechol resistance regulon transcriptional repressor
MEKIMIEENLRQSIDQFWETVPMVWNLIRGQLRTIAAEQFGISVEQFHVLRLIRKGLTSVRDIADARQISRPAASQAADLLVEQGLISRCEEVGDRRFVHLELTPQGEDLLNRMFEQNRIWMMEKMAALGAEDLALITEGLARLKLAFDPSIEKTQIL